MAVVNLYEQIYLRMFYFRWYLLKPFARTDFCSRQNLSTCVHAGKRARTFCGYLAASSGLVRADLSANVLFSVVLVKTIRPQASSYFMRLSGLVGLTLVRILYANRMLWPLIPPIKSRCSVAIAAHAQT